ncbi:hypothetical protein [Burkholderia ubonensis]|uniref:hypothetical protein n=1 Tax=Burkholderia ubonensis TaxID=101571 RepID=UPI000F5825DD|nr:hypothetical protein [Burkholderia ubonensis]RQP34141.1 hypothetical protein DF155_15750 [Burkholderia ubonensis]RQP40399.1 hypothetical protein DF154_13760 [Burkholderia ubonensis]RQP40538.1 hypothetical protein DF156_16200 [Burkholderia ubonensis]RQP53932.1 hypothetical protein DF144_16095 [Burkholderia ubonensis]RQP57414.1 hypothetical protein DF159_22295 [Burkholderia ubonensis]
MTKPTPPLAVDMRIQIPRGAGLRFGGRYATILQIKPKGTTIHLGNGKLVTFAYDALQDAIRRIGSA